MSQEYLDFKKQQLSLQREGAWRTLPTADGHKCHQNYFFLFSRKLHKNKECNSVGRKIPTSTFKNSKYSLCVWNSASSQAWAAEPLTQLWCLRYFWATLNIVHLRKQIITCQQQAGLEANCWKNKFKSSRIYIYVFFFFFPKSGSLETAHGKPSLFLRHTRDSPCDPKSFQAGLNYIITITIFLIFYNTSIIIFY